MGGIGQMLFGMVFNFILMLLFAPKPKDTITYGPRLDNLKPAVKDIQGQVINLAYGTTRISGTIFWCSDIRETAHTEVTEYSSKGGNDYTHTDVTYTYDCDIAVGICEGPIVGIRKIWANKELIYNVEVSPSAPSWLKYRIHEGTETQNPDPLLQAHLGTEIPAHRGLAYIVFEQFQLDPFGRRVPQSIEFEVVSKGVIANGAAYKFPQLSFNKFIDYGVNRVDEAHWWSRSSIFRLPNGLFAIVVLNPSNQKFIYVDVDQKTVQKFSATRGLGYHQNWYNGDGNYYYNYYDNDYYTKYPTGGDWWYAWMKVNFMGNSVKTIPIAISGTTLTNGGYVRYTAPIVLFYNLVSGSIVGTIGMPGWGVDAPHQHQIYNNTVIGARYWYGNTTTYYVNVEELFTVGNVSSAADVDKFGFPKSPLELVARPNWIVSFGDPNFDPTNINAKKIWTYSSDYNNEKNSYRMYLIDFPSTVSTKSACTGDLGETYTIKSYDWEIRKTAQLDNSYKIMYENHTFSPQDAFEWDSVFLVKVKAIISIKTYNCLSDQKISESTQTKYYWYPAHSDYSKVLGSWDTDPDPPQQVPPYDQNYDPASVIPLAVHYVDDETYPESQESDLYDNGNVYPILWIRYTDGRELMYMKSSINYNVIYKKAAFSEYTMEDTIEFNDGLDEYLNWWILQSTTDGFNKRVTIPNTFYKNGDDRYGDYYMVYMGRYLGEEVSSTSTKFNFNPIKFSLGKRNVSSDYFIPNAGNYTFVRGDNHIYWTNGQNIIKTNVNTLEAWVDNYIPGGNGIDSVYPIGNNYFVTKFFENGAFTMADLYYLQRSISQTEALLGEIIEDISLKAGIDLGILDISDAAYYTKVYGYNISDDIKLIDALTTLLMHFFIDAYESEWKIKYKTRKEFDKTNLIEIDFDELGVKKLGEDYNKKYNIIVREDIELPDSVNYTYIAAQNSFTQANVTAIRNIDFNLGIKTSIKCPIALLTTDAYANAFRLLFDMWRSLKEYEFRLPKKYNYLEPGDVVKLPIGASKYTNEYAIVKIIEVTNETSAFTEYKALDEDARNLDGLINDGAYEKETNTLIPTTPSGGTILDVPPLYNKYTNIDYDAGGVYVAAYGSSNYWKGGSTFVSYDQLAYYKYADFGPSSSVYGTIASMTTVPTSITAVQPGSSITIYVNSIEDFYSADEDDIMYREGNTIALISQKNSHVEIVQFKDISIDAEDPKLVTISNLTRGLYNTWRGELFIAGDNVVLLPVGVKKYNIEDNYFNTQVYYKMVSYGQGIDGVQPNIFTYQANWYRNPASPIKAYKSGSDVRIDFTRKERAKPIMILNNPTVSESALHTIKIYKGTDRTTAIRTIEDINTDYYTYTQADMTTDGLTADSSFVIRSFRKSDIIGYDYTKYYAEIGYNTKYIDRVVNSVTGNKLKLYINFSTQINNTLNITNNTGGYGTFTYNNYNGLGYLTPAEGFYSKNSVKITNLNEVVTCASGPTYSDRFTVGFWFKVPKNSGSCVADILTSNANPIVSIDINNNKLYLIEGRTSGSAITSGELPFDVWIFALVDVNNIAWQNIKTSMYTWYWTSAAGYSSNHNNWGNYPLQAPLTILDGVTNSSNAQILIQDLFIANDAVYSLDSSWAKADEILRGGLRKWQRQ
jgi:hypothetical protein